MNKQTAPQLRFKPSRFRRHDFSCVGNAEELVHGNGEKRKGRGHLARINTSLELFKAPNPADTVNPILIPQVGDSQNGPKHFFEQKRNVKVGDRRPEDTEEAFGRQFMP